MPGEQRDAVLSGCAAATAHAPRHLRNKRLSRPAQPRNSTLFPSPRANFLNFCILPPLLQRTTFGLHQSTCFSAQGNAGVAQLVERNLAKVEVASSSLVSRSMFRQAPSWGFVLSGASFLARSTLDSWQSGYAPDCKSVYSGSIPLEASN
ncbi:hypothetical protein G6F32_013575 [Rhizopus arrhizus]|nr:hypothetical protein G6F32_013575 [Rhizopus arrhizus]